MNTVKILHLRVRLKEVSNPEVWPQIAVPSDLRFHELHYVIQLDDRQFSQWISPNYGYPVTIIVGKDGKIAMTEHGTSSEKRAALKAKIEELR